MKRCPKCSRTFPDDHQKFCTVDGGLLLSSEQDFDPNATIAIRSPKASAAPPQQPQDQAAAQTPDFSATIAAPASTPKTTVPKKPESTGATPLFQTPAEQPTTALPPRSQSAPSAGTPIPAPPPRPQSAPSAGTPITAPSLRSQSAPSAGAPISAPAKKSKLPLILGILLLLLVLGVGALVALFFLVIKPRLSELRGDQPIVTRTSNENANNNTDNVNSNTAEPVTQTEFVPPSNAVKFTNSEANLDGKLAEHYVDFSFYYPQTWNVDPKAGVPGASNFAKVERRIPPDFTQENFAVGWYTSKGTVEADGPTFPQLVELLGSSLANGFPEYRKVSEGPTKINSLDAYEFRFVSTSKGTEKGDIELWGRVVFLPTGVSGNQTGATLIMLATSLAPEIAGVDDVGVKGEMPVILDSFRFGKSR